jgi:inorganic pyrophosphatase
MNMETVKAIIETPKGSNVKYDYEPETKFFELKKVLPAGMTFPYDFGFIPNTKGEDGDPLDIIVVSEFISFPGCMMECRVIGVITAEQTEEDNTVRNDRFIAIAAVSRIFEKIESIKDLPERIINEIQKFFINYNEIDGRVFKPLGTLDAEQALNLINKK